MPEKRWFWATLTLSSLTIVSVVLAAWEPGDVGELIAFLNDLGRKK
jgi:hypothetical protein